MESEREKQKGAILAPMDGGTVSLDKVPDAVFSERILGDGCAIQPLDGRVYSPVDGTVSSVADARHAYGFLSEDGTEVLVHVGLETVSLEGKGFRVYVKEGDRVKRGQLVAEVDLALLKEKGLSSLTPVLICNVPAGSKVTVLGDNVRGGKDELLALERGDETSFAPSHQAEKSGTGDAPKRKKRFLNFDFLQKLGKVLIVVIAVMPAAGLAISICAVLAAVIGALIFPVEGKEDEQNG